MKRPWTRNLIVFGVALLASLFGFIAYHSPSTSASNPNTVNFQGKMVNSDGTNVANGTYTFVFKLYTSASGGSAIWNETQASVAVSSGTFRVNLGSVCPFFVANACNGSTPVDFGNNPDIYLGITFNSDPAGEMSPRVQLQSVPFAFNSDRVGGLTANQLVQLSPSGQQSGSINVSGNINSGGSIQGGTLNATSTITLNGTNINTAGTLTNVAYLNQANTFSLNNTFSTSITTPLVTSSAALNITGGTTLSLQSTDTNAISIGTNATNHTTTLGTTSGTATTNIQAGSGGINLTGNTGITGTLGVSSTSNFGGKLTVTTGGADITGLLKVTGSSTISGTQDVAGDFSVATNKLTVQASTGNTLIAGNLVANGYINSANSGYYFSKGYQVIENLSDGWLRLNSSGSFYNGTFTPGAFRADGGITSYGGNLWITGTSKFDSKLTVSIGGASITGNLNVTGALSVSSRSVGAGVSHLCIASNNYVTDCTSSMAYKHDITPLSSEDYDNVLNAIASTPIFTYHWNEGEGPNAERAGKQNRFNTGVISEYLPDELLQGLDQNGNPIPDWNSITGYLWAGTRELTGRVTAQGNLNAQQSASLSIQNAKINTLSTTVDSVSSSVSSLTVLVDSLVAAHGALNTKIVAVEAGSTSNLGTTSLNDVNISKHNKKTTINGRLDVAQESTFNGGVRMDFKGADNLRISSDLGSDSILSLIAKPSTVDKNTVGMLIKQESASGQDGLSAGLKIDNENANTQIDTAFEIKNSGGAGYKNLIGSDNFSVNSQGDIKTKGSITANNSIQINSPDGQVIFSVNQGGSSHLAGLFSVDSLKVGSGLTVDGDMNVAGLSTFQKLATFIGKVIFKQDVQFDGGITVAKDTAGFAKVKANESSVHVSFSQPYTTKPVIDANVIDGQFVKASINNITTSGFDIVLAEPATTDTQFNWTALMTQALRPPN